uniref:Uncharacterized protein n=1 Tax=Ackermannviridae sp. TaxID=2831612 RepID=A0A8S5VK56_9CAUD|nr:MAG TPA: hypothetical protein [Ackermannviridae sp.]
MRKRCVCTKSYSVSRNETSSRLVSRSKMNIGDEPRKSS